MNNGYFITYPVFLDPDLMEEVNKILHNDPFRECTWVDKDDFEEHTELTQYLPSTISYQLIDDLENGKLDFIAFRLDY